MGYEHQLSARCEYGAETNKPTSLLLGHVKPHGWKKTCSHTTRLWKKLSTGEKRWAAHPPLKGKEWYIPAERWNSSMLLKPWESRDKYKSMPYLTSAAQAYPAGLNNTLAEVIVQSLAQTPRAETKQKYQLVGRWNNTRVRQDAVASSSTVRDKVVHDPPAPPHAGQQAHVQMLGGHRLRRPQRRTHRG